MNLNKALIAGRLTADPQLRATTSGQPVATFSVATNSVWTDKAGAKQEAVEFHNIVVWGKQAEVASKFLTKGALVLVEGRLQTRSWDDKTGVKRKTTEIVAERIQFGPRAGGSMGGAPRASAPAMEQSAQAAPVSELPIIEVEDEVKAEDLPF